MKKILLLFIILPIGAIKCFGQCLAVIPSNALSIHSTTTNNGGFTPLWVCSPDTLHSDGGIRNIYLESGSVMTTGGGIDTIYVKNGARLIMNGGIHVIYYVNIGDLSIGGGIPTYVQCNSLFFMYQNAPPGGCFPTCSLTVSINPPGPVNLCLGNSITLQSSVLNGSGPLSYLWNNGGTTASATVSTAGIDTLIVTDSTGCSGFAQVIVNVGSAPVNPVIYASGPLTFCEGDSVMLDAGFNYTSYLWSTGETTQSIVTDSQGVYYVNIVDTSGCTASSAPITVTVHPLPVVVIDPRTASVCKDSSFTFSAIGADTFLWQPGSVSGSSFSISPVSATQIIVTGSDTNSCQASDTVMVYVYPPTVTPVISQTGNLLTANPANVSYQWFLNGNSIPGANSQSYLASVQGTYTVVVTDSNGCTSSASAAFLFTEIQPGETGNMRIYPNPSTGIIYVDMGILFKPETLLEFMDMHGKICFSKNMNEPKMQILLQGIPAGIYFIRVDGKVTEKISVR